MSEEVCKVIAQPDKFLNENERRATYKSWPFSSTAPCSAAKMAEAGFIFIGSSREPDLVECFFCDKPLDGWEEDDDPWSEHLKHASYCEFAKMQKPQGSWTVRELLEFMERYEAYKINNLFEKLETQMVKQYAIMKNVKNSSFLK